MCTFWPADIPGHGHFVSVDILVWRMEMKMIWKFLACELLCTRTFQHRDISIPGYFVTLNLNVSPIYLVAVLEYLTSELLELAGNLARDHSKKRINPRHLQLFDGVLLMCCYFSSDSFKNLDYGEKIICLDFLKQMSQNGVDGSGRVRRIQRDLMSWHNMPTHFQNDLLVHII